ncbi:hypothetical protein [Parasphingorhabdus sp.]|uniref:hypothetical protein n=1 Tax=Parasphingorhabdus sp. TaxID=2709688 RepID=UPI0030EB5B8B
MAAKIDQSFRYDDSLSHFSGRWIAVGRGFFTFYIQRQSHDHDTGMGDHHLSDGGFRDAFVNRAAQQHFIHFIVQCCNNFWLVIYRQPSFGFGLTGDRGPVDFRLPYDRPVIY